MSFAAEVPPQRDEVMRVKRWERWGMSRAEMLTVALTGVIALATIGACLIAFAALKDAHEASRVDQRAWVGVSAAQMRPTAVGTQPVFSLEFTNSGRTPALNVVQTAGWRMSPVNAAFSLPGELMTKGTCTGGVLQPGGKQVNTTTVDHLFTPADVDGLNSGSGMFRTFGQITYEDVFGQKHETDFCYRLDPAGGPGFTACDTFNTAN